MEPIRNFFKGKSAVEFYEAEATEVDPERRVVHIKRNHMIQGEAAQSVIPYDMLVVGVGADNATLNVPGVEEHSCFLKNANDAQKIRNRITDCIETALCKGRSIDEIQKLLHFVVVGGGPTGVEFAAELQDYYKDGLRDRFPDIMDAFRITLIEALPNVLPMFSKQLMDYTESTLKAEAIDVLTKASVKEVSKDDIKVEVTKPDGTKDIQTIPYGLLVWATGNKQKGLIENLAMRLNMQQDSRRGLVVDGCLAVQGAHNIWALGDCANSKLPPTAQVAHQQGSYLAKVFNEMARTPSSGGPKIQPFDYNHQGALAYIGMDKAVADLNLLGFNVASHGFFTFLFWKAAYLNMCLSARSRFLVTTDWMKARVFGRDMFRE
ncbi:external alternative NADH-ubiquinone oxidoreductase, mitochondrial [Trichoderma asperellum]|uniref:NADH:ubiquinone reductase (non-electrogenic) n=1 Tax=Trichoderma asperellum TaxID=101201 RepID=A0A6V8QWY7_TRIAP|nr:external alternative NADH-ubiquinone oxidoreductase, mitochondrial [Trichoderma asperellum]